MQRCGEKRKLPRKRHKELVGTTCEGVGLLVCHLDTPCIHFFFVLPKHIML